MGKFLILSLTALICVSSAAFAADPVKLTDYQMSKIQGAAVNINTTALTNRITKIYQAGPGFTVDLIRGDSFQNVSKRANAVKYPAMSIVKAAVCGEVEFPVGLATNMGSTAARNGHFPRTLDEQFSVVGQAAVDSATETITFTEDDIPGIFLCGANKVAPAVVSNTARYVGAGGLKMYLRGVVKDAKLVEAFDRMLTGGEMIKDGSEVVKVYKEKNLVGGGSPGSKSEGCTPTPIPLALPLPQNAITFPTTYTVGDKMYVAGKDAGGDPVCEDPKQTTAKPKNSEGSSGGSSGGSSSGGTTTPSTNTSSPPVATKTSSPPVANNLNPHTSAMGPNPSATLNSATKKVANGDIKNLTESEKRAYNN